MKKVVFLSLFMVFTVVTSCSNKDIDPTGDYPTEEPQPNPTDDDEEERGDYFEGDEVDFTKLSLTEYNFGTEGGSVAITTEGIGWWIEGAAARTGCEQEGDFSSLEFIRGERGDIIKIKSDWFIVTKETSQKLVIEVEPNTSSKTRYLGIGIQQGNLFLNINITQSAE